MDKASIHRSEAFQEDLSKWEKASLAEIHISPDHPDITIGVRVVIPPVGHHQVISPDICKLQVVITCRRLSPFYG